MTLGAPAVHHSRFSHGGLARIKANVVETNKRLCDLQEKLQDVLILNSDIDDALDHLSHIIASPSTNIEYSVLKLSLQRVVKAVSVISKVILQGVSDHLHEFLRILLFLSARSFIYIFSLQIKFFQ